MTITVEKRAIVAKSGYETVRIEAWGRGIRVRSTQAVAFSGDDKALEKRSGGRVTTGTADDGGAYVQTDDLRCRISRDGRIAFFVRGQEVLGEYYRDWRGDNPHSPSMKVWGRTYKPLTGSELYKITVRFTAADGECNAIRKSAFPFIFRIKATAFCGTTRAWARRRSATITHSG